MYDDRMAYGGYQQPNNPYGYRPPTPPRNAYNSYQMNPSTPPGSVIQFVPDELSARKASFPMDGSAAYFVCEPLGEIYTKRLDLSDGKMVFEKFVKTSSAPPQYATQDDLARLKQELYDCIGGMNGEPHDAPTNAAGRNESHAGSAAVRGTKP